jgi:hypothetical protein
LITVGSGFLLASGATVDGEGPSISLLRSVVLGVVLLLTVVIVARTAVLLAGVDPEADRIAGRLVHGTDQQRLLSRWLQRTRWARNVGGLAGLAWWLFGTSASGDLLLLGVGGLAIGSIAAQLHHVGAAGGRRTASLDRRSVAGYLRPGWRWRLMAVALGAVLLGLTGLAYGNREAALFGLVAVGVVGVTHLVQRRVAGRRRPALSASLQAADDLARELAIDRGLAQPAFYFALVLIAHGAYGLADDIGGVAIVVSIGAWFYALWAWLRNRRLGLDFLMAQAPLRPAAS